MNSTPDESSPAFGEPASWLLRVVIVVAGLLLAQLYFYWPVIFGRQILLPLDFLTVPSIYLKETKPRTYSDVIQSDQVLLIEPARRFAASEIRAGRWPSWSPYEYGGHPVFGMWSSFQLLYVLWPSPRVLPYIQIASALVAGCGAYVFFRRVLRLSFWPSAVAAWCYPLTAFFSLWQGQVLPHSVAWLPWILWATHCAVKQPGGIGGVAVAIFSFMTITCGSFDVAGEVLLVSGFYVLFRIGQSLIREGITPLLLGQLVAPTAGWVLGFALSAGLILPFMEYIPTGARMHERAKGFEERPPVGLSALPLVILPELQGFSHGGSIFIGNGNLPESASTAYAGLIAALFLAPLAGARGMHRAEIRFWCVIGFLGMVWALNIPGLVEIFRTPVFRMLSFNRFVFVTGWSITCLSALGLDNLWHGFPVRRRRYFGFIFLLLVVALFSTFCALNLPEPLATKFQAMIDGGTPPLNVNSLEDLKNVKWWFIKSACFSILTCVLSLLGWACVLLRWIPHRWIFAGAGGALLCELLRFSAQSSLMCEPELYYPPIPVFEELAKAPPGRVVGAMTLPPRVLERYGFMDLRGYDAVDPSGIVDLLDLGRDKRYSSPGYARTQWYFPFFFDGPDGKARISGVLNQLNLRYLIFSSQPSDKLEVRLSGDGYWIWENPNALPRAFIPHRVFNGVPNKWILNAMSNPRYDARENSFAEIGKGYTDSRGEANIVRENPCEIEIDVEMDSPGLVILSDQWNPGWKGQLNGQPVPIVRANYSLRGVEVPAGHSTITMRYQPDSLARGFMLGKTGLLVCAIWASAVVWGSMSRKKKSDANKTEPSTAPRI